MNKYSVYVPSKGRAEDNPTARLLEREGIDFVLVVEPQDAVAYEKAYPNRTLVLKEDDKGLGYSRNECKKRSISLGESWHWQIDDNVNAFRVREGGRNELSTASHCLETAETFINRFKNVGLAALTHVSFAFARKTDVGINKQCSSVVLVNNELNLSWRENIVEDTDYSMQVLHYEDHSWCTLLLHRLLFQKPAQNSMEGGMSLLRNKVEYRQTAAENLSKAWPGSFTVKIVPDKRLGSKHRVMPSRVWMGFTQRPVMV